MSSFIIWNTLLLSKIVLMPNEYEQKTVRNKVWKFRLEFKKWKLYTILHKITREKDVFIIYIIYSV